MVDIDKLRFSKEGFETIFSPMESDLLTVLWKKRKVRVRDVHSILRKKREIALTSVAVSLDRLYKKGVVDRDIGTGRGGQHYIYSTRKSKKEFEESVINNVVDKLITKFGSSAVSYFNDRFGKKKR